MNRAMIWHDVLALEKKNYFIKTLQAVAVARSTGKILYPCNQDIFNAFRLTELHQIKVVIVGQDPYPGPGYAHGLAFSVRQGIPIPPSLNNIYKELENDLVKFTRPNHGCLESWAIQGVMLLNAILTVEVGTPHSQANWGWEIFTDKVISVINKYRNNIVFLLWGKQAQNKGKFIDCQRHTVLQAPHPSPLSAHRGFFGCRHFSKANHCLTESGIHPIDWTPRLLNNNKPR
ncbi:MAG: uracil-DNA glycosylase [Candidatus Dasytiphilus stammeri]